MMKGRRNNTCKEKGEGGGEERRGKEERKAKGAEEGRNVVTDPAVPQWRKCTQSEKTSRPSRCSG